MMRLGASDYLLKGNLARLVPVVERELREAVNRRAHRRAEQARRPAGRDCRFVRRRHHFRNAGRDR